MTDLAMALLFQRMCAYVEARKATPDDEQQPTIGLYGAHILRHQRTPAIHLREDPKEDMRYGAVREAMNAVAFLGTTNSEEGA